MSDQRLDQRLHEVEVPDEDGAEERGWRVVSAAYEERTPARPGFRIRRLTIALAASLVLLALALSPAGAKVVDVVRDVVGIDESETQPALDSLPAAGELLVDSGEGPWIVREDGSKRRLGDYGESTWSAPRGLFVAAGDGRQLVALDPLGEIRWTVTAPAEVRSPSWSPSGFRIAYRSGNDLRVVSGDGTDDHIVADHVAPVAPAWRPAVDTEFTKGSGAPGAEQITFVDSRGRPHLVDADNGDPIPSELPPSVEPGRHPIREIAWTPDGSRVVTISDRTLMTGSVTASDAAGFVYVAPQGTALGDLAVAPSGDELALVERGSGVSELRLVTLSGDPELRSGPLFAGPGAIMDPTWSPDGRWLLAGWRDADQWLFIRSDRPRRLVAIDEISEQFDPGGEGGSFPRVSGWVLPQR